MSDTGSQEKDPLTGTEQPFVQHLKELRDRLVKSFIAVAVMCAVLSVYPGPGQLYDLLAEPLVAQLPGCHADCHLGHFPVFSSAQDHVDGSIFAGTAGGALPGLGICSPRLVCPRKTVGVPVGHVQHHFVFYRRGILLFLCLWTGL